MAKIGDTVYLKSGGPAMTVTEDLPGDMVGVKWMSGSVMMAATFPSEALSGEDTKPKIARAEADVAARDNPDVDSKV